MKNISIARLPLLLSSITIIVIVAISGLFFISSQYRNFERELQEYEKEYLHLQNQMLMREADSVIDFINFNQSRTDEVLRNNIKEKVYDAYLIASNIYENNKNTHKTDQIEKMVKEALRPITFNRGRGYYFAVSMDGVEQLYPVKPEFEGVSVIDLMDAKGNYVIRDEIDTVKSNGEGYVMHYWEHPGKEKGVQYLKISFVKYFEPLDWYIGAGEYLDDVEADIKAESLKVIEKISFGENGFVNIIDYSGKILAYGKETNIVGQNVKDLDDNYDLKLINDHIRSLEIKDKQYVKVECNLSKEDQETRISYVRDYDTWQWQVISVMCIDKLSEEMEIKRIELRKEIVGQVRFSALLFMISIAVVLAITSYFTRHIKKGIVKFGSFFMNYTDNYNKMDASDIPFVELNQLCSYTNHMVDNLKAAQISLKSEKDKLKKYLDVAGIVFIVTDEKGLVKMINKRGCKISGYSEEEIIGYDCIDKLIPDEYKREVYEGFKKMMDGNPYEFEQHENPIITKSGEIRYISWHNIVIKDKGSETVMLSSGEDITERKMAEEKVNYLAYYDTLTGLPNRTRFIESFQRAISQAATDKEKLVVMFLDLDKFKNINDTLGHEAGDLLLKIAAKRLKTIVHADDMVARLGGDEFTILLHNVQNRDDIVKIADRVLEVLAMPFLLNETEVNITVSIGISIYPKDGNQVETILKSADMAMYQAKEKGRNNHKFFSDC